MSPEQIFIESAKFMEVLVYCCVAAVSIGLFYVVFTLVCNADFSED